jgi:16S rRNA (guanine966-N2)-methyltransferase
MVHTQAGDYRPTTGLVKKSLFDTLSDEIEGSRWLDLFSGSGAVGLEALSRGAAFVAFVDMSPVRLTILRKNLESLGIDGTASRIIPMDYQDALERLRRQREQFDFVFVDPPYGKIDPAAILGDIVTSGILADDGLVVYEVDKRGAGDVIKSIPPELYPLRERVLGGTALLFLRWRESHLKSSEGISP